MLVGEKTNFFEQPEFEKELGCLSKNQLESVSKLVNKVKRDKYPRRRGTKYGNLQRGLSPEQFERLCACTDSAIYRFSFELMYYLGLRTIEAIELKETDFDLKRKHVRVNTAKQQDGLKVAFMPLHDAIYDKVMIWLETRKTQIEQAEGFVLYSPLGRKYSRLHGAGIRRAFRDACEKAGLVEVYADAHDKKNPKQSKEGSRKLHVFSVHSLRRSFINSIWKNTKDIKTTQLAARHSDASTTLNVYVEQSSESVTDKILRTFE